VLLTEQWVAKVADFGTKLTKYAGQAEGPAGTPTYMAPEAFALTSGAKAKPTDVWSFGSLATIYSFSPSLADGIRQPPLGDDHVEDRHLYA